MRRSVTFIARVDTSPGATSGTATDMYGSKETDTFEQLGHTTVDLKKPSSAARSAPLSGAMAIETRESLAALLELRDS